MTEEEDDDWHLEGDSQEELETIGKQLKKAGKSKDTLVKLLKVSSLLLGKGWTVPLTFHSG